MNRIEEIKKANEIAMAQDRAVHEKKMAAISDIGLVCSASGKIDLNELRAKVDALKAIR